MKGILWCHILKFRRTMGVANDNPADHRDCRNAAC